MDRNSPDFYVEKTEDGVRDAEEFAKYTMELCKPRMHRAESLGTCTDSESEDSSTAGEEPVVSPHNGNNNNKVVASAAISREGPALVTPVITPRFVPSCTPEMLQVLLRLLPPPHYHCHSNVHSMHSFPAHSFSLPVPSSSIHHFPLPSRHWANYQISTSYPSNLTSLSHKARSHGSVSSTLVSSSSRNSSSSSSKSTTR